MSKSYQVMFTTDLIFELKLWISFLGFDVTALLHLFKVYLNFVFKLNVWLLGMSAHYSLEHVKEVTWGHM